MREKDEQIFAKDKAAYLPVFSRYGIVLDHGEGAYVYDSSGKKYIDFLAGIAVNVLGHAHPALVRAVTEQAKKMIHCSNLYYTQAQADAAARLAKLSGLGKVFFGNSGAEANEGAIKLARKHAWRRDPEKIEIITAYHSFHGRTLASLTATGQPHYHEGFGPLPGGFSYVDYGDGDALEKKMSEKTCAVMLETIQGEGGVHVPPPGYLERARELCNKYDACLILDEIQCGMGRTGTFFAYEQFGIKPDIVTLAKGLAGGVPIGAFIASDKVAAAFAPGDHGSTFGGNPLACAAALAVQHIFRTQPIFENAAVNAKWLTKRMETEILSHPNVGEVRHLGLIHAFELVADKKTKEPLPAAQRTGYEVYRHALRHGLLLRPIGDVLYFNPPLNITQAELDTAIDLAKTALNEVLPATA